jgi:hypothetical protein
MAHYAFMDNNNNVSQVISGRDENDLPENVSDWELYYADLIGQTCKRTSYNTIGGVHYIIDEEGNRVPSEDQSKALRKNYAGIGFTYDEARDAFILPKPKDGEWVLDENTCLWVEVTDETI